VRTRAGHGPCSRQGYGGEHHGEETRAIHDVRAEGSVTHARGLKEKRAD
jgi:hypothetical protein